MKSLTATAIAASAIASLSLASTTALACNGGYSYRSYSTPTYPRYVERATITVIAVNPPVYASTPALLPQGFAGGLPQGLPRGVQSAPQIGMPPTNGVAPQGQGFAQQLPRVMSPGVALTAQHQNLGAQQSLGNLPQGGQPGLQPQPQMMGGQIGPQSPTGEATSGGSAAQRIADELTGLPGLPGGPSAGPSAGPVERPMPSILIGSVMSINGQPLGDNRGTVRLIVNGAPVTLEILEWSASSAKVRIPADLPAGLQIQIEIVRADGSVVANDTAKLAAGQPMAAAK